MARIGGWPERARFWVLIALIAACFLWGGGSRSDIPGLLWLEPLAFLFTAVLVLIPGQIRWGSIRMPLLMLAALALLVAIQLIPLPPALWRALPGHGNFLPFLDLAGGQDRWHPLSITPDLTLGTLMGLCVPFAALIGFASVAEEDTRLLLPILLITVGLSVMLGLGQVLGGPQSGFYRYAITNGGSAVGFFSNRNHAALFLTMAWPMLALWATGRARDPQQQRIRRWVAGAAAVALLPMVAVTGSRAGLVLAPVAVGFGWWLLRSEVRSAEPESRWTGWRVKLGAVLVSLAILTLAFTLSRAEALQRLISTNLSEENRLVYVPTLWRIALDFLPFGSGFGSFDPVFRFYEPDALLIPTYLNHAHNDLLEIVITGGLPALILFGILLVWTFRRLLAIRRANSSRSGRFGILAFAMIALTLLASLADYPLRTPLHAMLFAFACAWLAQVRPAHGAENEANYPLRS
jgi:O-antigen ligase